MLYTLYTALLVASGLSVAYGDASCVDISGNWAESKDIVHDIAQTGCGNEVAGDFFRFTVAGSVVALADGLGTVGTVNADETMITWSNGIVYRKCRDITGPWLTNNDGGSATFSANDSCSGYPYYFLGDATHDIHYFNSPVKGVLSPDGGSITWTNGAFYTRQNWPAEKLATLSQDEDVPMSCWVREGEKTFTCVYGGKTVKFSGGCF